MEAVANTPPKEIPRTPNWFFKNGMEIRKDFIKYIHKNREELGDIYRLNVIGAQIFVLTHPDYAQHILQTNNKNYHKSFGYDVLELFLGKGLLTSEGDFWLKQRRLAQPAFYKKRLQGITKGIGEEAKILVQAWEKRASQGSTFDLREDLMEATMKIVARSLFSANVNEQIPMVSRNIGILNEFAVKRIQSLIKLPLWIPIERHLRFKKRGKELDELIYQIIESRKNTNTDYDDLLAMLMEAEDLDTGERMNKLQLRDEVMTIFIAGHETSAIAMSWVLHLLAQHPEIQEKLHEELDRVLAGKIPTFEDIPSLVYTRQVIDESMRLYPPAWLVGRKALEEDQIGDYHIKAGSNLLISTYEIHHHPDLWEEPSRFDPERFEPAKAKKYHKFAYFPFGGGPRMCIGNNFALMEMVILTASLAQRFNLIDRSKGAIQMDPLITLRPKDPIPIQLKLRKA